MGRLGEVTRALRISGSGRAGGVPPGTGAWCAAAFREVKEKPVTWRKRKNGFEQGDRFRDAAEKKIRRERVRRKLTRNGT